jgi:hypothetical protein
MKDKVVEAVVVVVAAIEATLFTVVCFCVTRGMRKDGTP